MFVSSRGYKISYQVFGAGQVVVLLHGHPMWGGRWVDRGYVAGLQDRFRVIVPDLLGHGDSDKPHEPAAYGDPRIAADVLAVMEREGAKQAHVWGYSWGAAVAEHLAVAAPGRLLSLTLGGFPVGLDATQRATLLGEPPASIEEMFADWPPTVAAAYIERNDFCAILAVRQTMDKFPVTIGDLRAAPHPTLAYCGADDPFLDLARQQARALPCRFEQVPGDHVIAFAEAANVLHMATAHFDAAARSPAP
jgi:pimeloyl-ACP methyl ester carboxylesterase